MTLQEMTTPQKVKALIDDFEREQASGGAANGNP